MWRSRIDGIEVEPLVHGGACPDLTALAADVRPLVRAECGRCETGRGPCVMEELQALAEQADAEGPGGFPVD